MIHHPITFTEYKALAGISNSYLKQIDRTPRHLQVARLFPQRPTDAMLKGSLTDHLLFGTELAYAVSPYPEFKSNEAKAWRDDHRRRGVAIFKQDTVDEVKTMVQAIKDHPAAAELLASGRSQVGITGEINGVECKGLLDWVSDDVAAITDLKTTEDASESGFQKHVVNMGYDVQAATYHDLWQLNTGEDIAWTWIVQESEPPFLCAVYCATPEILDRGREILRTRLAKYRVCLEADSWPGYPEGAQMLCLPAWAAPKK